MKKVLFAFASAILALTSCSNESELLSPNENAGKEVMTTISVGMAPKTRATIDNDGAAAYVNRCILEVRTGADKKVYRHVEVSVDPATLTATFQLPLVISQTYDFLFWADNANFDSSIGKFSDKYYDTQDLTAVKILDETTGNLDAKDAFFTQELGVEFTGTAPLKEYILTRPFAQVNIVTSDLENIKAANDQTLALGELWPAKISVNYTTEFPTQFNVSTGLASELKVINRKAEAVYGCAEAKKYNTLNMDYIFVNEVDGEDTTPFAITKAEITSKNGKVITILESAANIPMKRNYRTNILGSFLTDPQDFKVEVSPLWLGDNLNDELPAAPGEPVGYEWIDEENKEAAAVPGNQIVIFPEGTLSFDMNPATSGVPYNFDVEQVTFPASVQNFPTWCLGECKYLNNIVIEGGEDCDLHWGANWLYGVYECNAEGRYIPIEERGRLNITIKNLPKSFTTDQKYISCESSTPDIEIHVPVGWKDKGYYYKFNHAGNSQTTPRTVYVIEGENQIWPEN